MGDFSRAGPAGETRLIPLVAKGKVDRGDPKSVPTTVTRALYWVKESQVARHLR